VHVEAQRRDAARRQHAEQAQRRMAVQHKVHEATEDAAEKKRDPRAALAASCSQIGNGSATADRNIADNKNSFSAMDSMQLWRRMEGQLTQAEIRVLRPSQLSGTMQNRHQPSAPQKISIVSNQLCHTPKESRIFGQRHGADQRECWSEDLLRMVQTSNHRLDRSALSSAPSEQFVGMAKLEKDSKCKAGNSRQWKMVTDAPMPNSQVGAPYAVITNAKKRRSSRQRRSQSGTNSLPVREVH
jgi:hypothetical protein